MKAAILIAAVVATLGSALSYIHGVSKEKADEGVDQALMGIRPGRTGVRARVNRAPKTSVSTA